MAQKVIKTNNIQKEKARPKEPVGGPGKNTKTKWNTPADGGPGVKSKPMPSVKFGRPGKK